MEIQIVSQCSKTIFLIIVHVFALCIWLHVEASPFDVIPGGQTHTMGEELGGVVCKFTYKCQGGTKENWDISMTESGGEHHCHIGRPDKKSYLFFQEVLIEVEGGHVKDAKFYKNDGRILGKEQFNIDKKGMKVSNTGKFEAELSVIDVTITAKKEEL